jgi:glycosyltransferase involved in cell wall biosynthesis
MAAVYSGIDLLCLSSAFGEGTPNAVAEAMACGCPCVATDVGDTRALLGPAGTIVPPRDAAALAAAILDLALLPQSERARLGALGRARIVEHFGPDRLVERTLAAFAGEGIGRPEPTRP